MFLNKNDKGDVTVTGIIHEHMEAQNIKDYTLIKKKKKKKDVHEDKILDKLQNFNLMVTTVQTKF